MSETVLICVATAREGDRLAGSGEVLVTGVGVVNAAYALTRRLAGVYLHGLHPPLHYLALSGPGMDASVPGHGPVGDQYSLLCPAVRPGHRLQCRWTQCDYQ